MGSACLRNYFGARDLKCPCCAKVVDVRVEDVEIGSVKSGSVRKTTGNLRPVMSVKDDPPEVIDLTGCDDTPSPGAGVPRGWKLYGPADFLLNREIRLGSSTQNSRDNAPANSSGQSIPEDDSRRKGYDVGEISAALTLLEMRGGTKLHNKDLHDVLLMLETGEGQKRGYEPGKVRQALEILCGDDHPV